MNAITSCCGIPDMFRGIFKQCDPTECCCGCCSALRPRYKRLVDNIFPSNPQDGLVKSNMEKLTFYTLSSPEKLDRIGEYLAQKVARDLSRHRNGYVIIAMDAMDQLLIACHAQTLNLFVESFLKIVQQLLESQESHMQLLATRSFLKFANIEEDTPSYHRRYDFFVSKFSSLCHNGNGDLELRNKLRMAGLNGLKGVIRKTVGDDLQVDIWDETHMDKIVPSLLYNMQCLEITVGTSPTDETSFSTPGAIAEECLRELIGRASFGHVRSVIKPILKHLDNHNLWDSNHPTNFAIHTFKIIMYSIQTQHSYAVIQMLMNHLEEKSRNFETEDARTKVRTGIVNVLSNIVAISASEAIGPSVLEIINSLLNYLRTSINNSQNAGHADDENRFQDAVINTLGEFANNFPDFQKIEIMIFILSKAPPTASAIETDIRLQHILLKSLLRVSTKYKSLNMTQAFPTAFLNPLLSRSLSSDSTVRFMVQVIFHQLLDRHNNLPQLTKPLSLSSHDQLRIEKAYRQDLMFMKKHGPELLLHIYDNIQISNNTLENFNSIYTTLALICIEMNSEETLTELLRLIFAIQDIATVKNSGLNESHRASVHCIVAGFLHLIGHLTAIPALCTHIEQVIKLRHEKSPWLLPDYGDTDAAIKSKRSSQESKFSTPEEVSDELLFNRATITEALRSTGHDTTKLLTPFMPRNVVDASMTRSISDLNNITVEVDSVNSSPGMTRKLPEEEITFESIKKIITEPFAVRNDEIEMRRIQVIERFKTLTFDELVSRTERRTNELQHRLNEIFSKFPPLFPPSSTLMFSQNSNINMNPKGDDVRDSVKQIEYECYSNPFRDICNITVNEKAPPLFALRFPDLFVY